MPIPVWQLWPKQLVVSLLKSGTGAVPRTGPQPALAATARSREFWLRGAPLGKSQLVRLSVDQVLSSN